MGMKTVFMGTPFFACPCLELLFDEQKVLAVVTQPDRPRGRGRRNTPSPVKEIALQQGIKVLEPERIKDEAFFRDLADLNPEIIVVVAFGQILPSEILRVPQRGCINIHASLLPKYRGAAPIQRAIIQGEKKTGISIIQMDEGMDTGDLLLADEVLIGPEESAGELQERLATLGSKCLSRTLREIESGRTIPKPQDSSKATYAPMLSKSEGRIDWECPCETIRNKIRGMNPWPVASTTLDGKGFRIFRGRGDLQGIKGKVGEVLEANDDGIRVQTGEGHLLLQEVQFEGRKRMAAGEFLRGYPAITGKVLGE
jgi:methionyl-tRNA formyltransferase